MSIYRKSKLDLHLSKNCRSSSQKKLEKPQHLLAKPNTKKFSVSKQALSFSTLNTYNMSKTTSSKLTLKSKKGSSGNLSRCVESTIKNLTDQLYRLESTQPKITSEKWYEAVKSICIGIKHQKVKQLVTTIQMGYICEGLRKTSCESGKETKLNLNIKSINKDKIFDYHDQFMGKIDEFSPSWRQMIFNEEKRKK